MTAPAAPIRPRLRVGFGAAVVLVLLGLAVAVLVAALSPKGEETVVSRVEPTGEVAGQPSVGDVVLLVHVLGAVPNPGLYELAEGARTVDAVAAAGGFLDTADQAGLNLARRVTDGEQLYVPAIGEAPPPTAAESGGKVNLNVADAAALEALPRIGPATAAQIIDWREANGGFATIDDLRNVPGIGEKTFDGLKDLVTV